MHQISVHSPALPYAMLNPSLGEPMSGTRRLTAILAADVVGYSRLMGEDEEATARAAREHRDAARPIVAGLGDASSARRATACCWNFPPWSPPSNARSPFKN